MSAEKRYPTRAMFVVDWDGTCVEEVWPGMGDWLPGAVDALRALSKKGKTVIYSLRCHRFEMDDVTPRRPELIATEYARIRRKLDGAGLQAIEIYPPDKGKPPGQFYIDDRAIEFRGDWSAILERVMR